ncbi:RNA-directed DNA polymerase [Listeria seeligeri]|uniref:retron Ec67 family RNA-directed DNA polymerase/endonuclease n=1 Tax=Listeria seeligeri TaxID=1640 RepID=UPI001623303A|nr:retron Ec67 family RNA-directed DNA polymerase/endonuclease [Listeria seeligeri]MBC1481719.1 RNA-directed DNA polymerase [Listeria seeligeri]
MKTLKNIENRKDLADYLNIPIKRLTYIIYIKRTENLYYSFEIPKKSGGVRNINAPKSELKALQRKLAYSLTEYQKILQNSKNKTPNISHGFEKGKSIITNAKIHRNKKIVYNLDLENFFESFHFGRVRGFFEKNKDFELSREVATVIAQLSCFNGTLPQGAPSSPIITNFICKIMDMRILKLAKNHKLDYTRYADDLTFSTNDKNFIEQIDCFLHKLTNEVEKAGFKLNKNKTNLSFKDSRQLVTGLVVNKKINVDRRYYKETRAMANRLYKTGEFQIDDRNGTLNQLEGRFSFINQVQRYNNLMDSSKHNFNKLNTFEKQYQAFLFYKYFYSNNKPVIVTEGKTDIKYIKAALKAYHLEFPDLIVKKEDGEFDFKVAFLRRTKRLSHFLNVKKDGADTMKNICKYFFDIENEKAPNYLKTFKNLTKEIPSSPTILIIDNELINKNKPVSKIIDYVKLNEKSRHMLAEKSYLNLEGSLYLLMNPLVNDKTECEIEDLFDEATLNHEVNGKKFSREKNMDPNKYYSKEIFSTFISNEYSKINFSNFKPMLENLNLIIEEYN